MSAIEYKADVWRWADVALALWLGAYACVVASSEALSAFGAFRADWIRALWIFAALGASAAAWRVRGRLKDVLPGVFGVVRWPTTFTGWCLFATAALTLACAALAPSSAQDALVYHLPRASHWLSNGSTAFYETAIARQNYQAQGFSLCVAHLLAVCGGDRLVNLLQWGAWWMLAAAAGLAAQELGAGVAGRRCAVVLALTLPQAVAQSTQAVGDLFAAVPLLAFALYLLRMERSEGRPLWRWSLAAGAALGLACEARQTGFVYGAVLGVPLGLGLFLRRWRRCGAKPAFVAAAALGLAALIGLGCVAPQMVRNWKVYRDPFSGEPRHALTTERLTPGLFAVNVLKHIASHVAMPAKVLNAPVERAVRGVCGTAVEDPSIHCNDTVFPIPFKVVSTLGKDASFVANPLHFILFAAVLAVWLATGGRARVLLWNVGAPVACGALLYCALFKWQLWAVRLTIPLYGWMAVGVGAWMAEQRPRVWRGVLGTLAACAVAQAAVRPVWFMPAFVFGAGPEGSGITCDMTVADKLRRLAERGFPSSDRAAMHATAPEVERGGYSLFFTPRQRQYWGNELYRNASWRYGQLEDALRCVARVRADAGVSKTLGLLVSSDHSNLPPEVRREPFPCEYPMWTWGGGEAGGGAWRWEHFGASDPAARAREVFGERGGVMLSDGTRESVIGRLRAARRVTCVFSNAVFNVFQVGVER